MTDTIRPALTPEEWAHTRTGIVAVPDSPNYHLRFFVGRPDQQVAATHIQCAALALHGQPFGFTREHVRVLMEDVVLYDESNPLSNRVYDAILEIAGLIDSLLPPEPK